MIDPVTGKYVMEAGEETARREITHLSPKAALELDQVLGDLAEHSRMKAGNVTGSRTEGLSRDEKKLAMLGDDLKRTLTDEIDKVVPEGALPARRAYSEAAALKSSVDKLMRNPRMAFANLRNADISSNMTNKQLFHKVDRVLGTDLGERAKMSEALELFNPDSRQSWFAKIARYKSIPAGAAGAVTGATIQRKSGDGSGLEGAILGGGLGALLGSPAAMRWYITKGLQAGALNQGLGPLRPGVGGQLLQEPLKNAWMGMGEKP
jgi:hypothetical protein